MADTLTDDALTAGSIPSGDPGWAADLRKQAFEAYQALPIPSQDTEEWRYTDLADLDLASFAPFAPGERAENLDQVPERVLAATGTIGDRAGLLIQHNSETSTAHLDPEVERAGVHFEGIDDALRDHPDLLEDQLGALVPYDRTKFAALHAAFRTGGTFVHVPKGLKV